MFLHEEPSAHLLGNMLFLWLFGSAVEGRLRSLKFSSPVPWRAGFARRHCPAGVSQVMVGNSDGQFSLGASGAIMGLAGAYIYMFPHAIIVVFRLFGGILSL